eukprot:Pgem_evm1s16172
MLKQNEQSNAKIMQMWKVNDEKEWKKFVNERRKVLKYQSKHIQEHKKFEQNFKSIFYGLFYVKIED